ncbi:hydroxyacid dehydrogenase [Rhodobacterales bacterium HKCCE2091]|nr:hydroxyacid dehydrogenase [Rhodobacterales bacterium HKCCE2091]
MKCAIVQPIHRSGLELLRAGGVEPMEAASTGHDTLAPILAEADAAIVRNWGFPAAAFALAPRLKVIGVHGTGTDRIDMVIARARGIPVVATPGANAQSVAEHALALILAVARGVTEADRAMQAGDFAYRERVRGRELAGSTLGLWGWGEVSRRLAPMARAVGMEVLVLSAHADPAALAATGVGAARDAADLLARADVLSLHGRPGDRPILGAAEIAAMRPGAILVNTARGALVDEAALAAAVRGGHLSGAGLDVFTREPPDPDSPLRDCPGIVLTPHVGGTTEAAMRRMATGAARAVLQVLTGAGA